jgi:hypothetical protein
MWSPECLSSCGAIIRSVNRIILLLQQLLGHKGGNSVEIWSPCKDVNLMYKMFE